MKQVRIRDHDSRLVSARLALLDLLACGKRRDKLDKVIYDYAGYIRVSSCACVFVPFGSNDVLICILHKEFSTIKSGFPVDLRKTRYISFSANVSFVTQTCVITYHLFRII